ncbi:MAG: aminopeptidase, partial [Nitrosopumilus sp. BACL13 MAG-120910-bin56]
TPPTFVWNSISAVSQIIEGAKISLYKFDKFKADKSDKSPDLTIIVSKSNESSKAIKVAEIISEGVIFAKNIANLPPNECTPTTLANFAKEISKKNKMKCTIISQPELKKKGFGGITAVGKGSKNEPKLITIEHNHGPKSQKPIVLVGKAVTFDTGGISLKPGQGMDEMKFDKCGGCTVLGIMKSVSELKLPINVVGIIPSVENMIGGEAYRPGDIIKLYNGKTAEILNTDAEGRLILADALAYGEKQYSPKAIIDFATLTGACIVALGNNVAAIVSNDKQLTKEIINSSKNTTEEIWELPLTQDYMDMIKSDVADIKNVGIGKAAGTITAAAFLKSAIKDTPWVHFDIAGVAWTQGEATKQKPYNPKGATGFGVRLILDYLQKL